MVEESVNVDKNAHSHFSELNCPECLLIFFNGANSKRLIANVYLKY